MKTNIAAHLRRLPRRALALGGALLLAANLTSTAGTVQLVRNINTTLIPQSSYPAPLGSLGGKMLFGATDATGPALWSTDGTAGGTHVLQRLAGLGIVPGSPWNDFLVQGSRAFIVSADASGVASLWVTDGTPGGTSHVISLAGGSTATPVLEGLLNTTVIFSNVDTSLVGQLFATDGTPTGTHQLTAFTAQTGGFLNGFFVAGDKFYFVASDPSYNRSIWVSDGTAAGTQQISSNTSSVTSAALYNPQGFQLVGNLVLYESSGLLWSIDTTTGAISNVITNSGIAGFGPPTVQGTVLANMSGFVLFLGDSGIGVQNSLQLWRSDGTSAGTSLVTTVSANATQNELSYPVFEKVGNKVVYIGDDGVNGPQLWSSDGTLANTIRLTSATAPASMSFQVAIPLSVIGGTAYFLISDGASTTTYSLWRTDGSAGGTQRLGGLPSIDAGELGASRIAGDTNTVYFGIYPTLTSPASVYKYLPASNSSTLAKAGLPLFATDEFAFNGGLLFFSVNDPAIGDEPWVSDGTAAGTHLIEDINPQLADNGSSPDGFVNFGGRLAFAADDGVMGRELWISDGTAAGTTLLADINPGAAGSNPNHLFAANGALYFFATDASGSSKFMRLAKAGAAAQVLATLSPQATSVVAFCGSDGAVAIGTQIYFAANDGQTGLELWTSDGTAQGTHRVADIAAGAADAGPCYLTALNGRVYFSANGPQGNELWSSDGTMTGTFQVADIAPGTASSNPYDLMVFNGALYFGADDMLHGIELWKSDGTAGGTVLAADIVPGANGSDPYLQGILNGRLLLQIFLGSTPPGTYVSQLWNSDGTSGGTQPISSQLFTASPSAFVNGTHVFLGAQDTAGVTPWVSDGTSGGTHPLIPSGNSVLFFFDDFSGITLFEVPDPTKGAQLWRTDGTTAGTKLVSVEPSVTNTPSSASARQHLTVGQQFFLTVTDPIIGAELYALTNDPPVAVADSGTSSNDAAVTIDLLANDSDSDGSLDPTTIVITTNPAHGSAVVNAGKVLYTPSTGFAGTDSFAYTVKDNQGATSAPAIVTVTVTAAVAAPPTHGGGGGAITALQLLGGMLLLAAQFLRANKELLGHRESWRRRGRT
jgi:ELWxxDGT repeat protein